jgi:ketosteroid isomerase-like protein
MSPENVRRAYRVIEAFNRRDLGAFLALMHDDVQAGSRLTPMEGEYQGHEGTRRWWANLLDAMPDLDVVVDDVETRGDLTVARLGLALSGETATVRSPLWHVAEWRDGKVTWWSAYQDEAEALEAVALRCR